MGLEIGGLIGNQRITDGMGFVKSIVGKVEDFIIDFLGNFLLHSVGDGAGNAPLRVAVDEGFPLLQNDRLFFLGDGPAHIVGLSQGVATQLAENLNDLFLIYNTTIGDR